MCAIQVVDRLVEAQTRTIRGRLEQVLRIEINITDPQAPGNAGLGVRLQSLANTVVLLRLCLGWCQISNRALP